MRDFNNLQDKTGIIRKQPGSEMLSMAMQLVSDKDEF